MDYHKITLRRKTLEQAIEDITGLKVVSSDGTTIIVEGVPSVSKIQEIIDKFSSTYDIFEEKQTENERMKELKAGKIDPAEKNKYQELLNKRANR